MSSFAAWGLTVLGLATVTTVAEMLLPQGKTRKVIRSVFASLTALVMITPVPSLIKNGVDFDFVNDSVTTDAQYLEYVESQKARLLSSAAENYLKNNGYEGVNINVELDGFKVKKAIVEFDRTGMTDNDGHINKSEIIGLIADYFDIGKEAVMTYG